MSVPTVPAHWLMWEEGGFSCPGQDEEGDLSKGGRVALTQGSQLWVDSVWSTGYRGCPEGTVSFRRGEANSWAALQTLPCLGQMKLLFPVITLVSCSASCL